ncbi:MAG: integration host factor subunit alpha [Alphaproteobacteria bacterium]|nr:integration host factor subunit alpha [Alphaproteobacteria bacterium]
MKTITRVNITEAIYEEIGLSRKDSGDVLDMVIEEIRRELVKGNDVKISSFGTFSLRKKNARIGRNPKTGEEKTITPRTVISFKPSQTLRKAADSGKVLVKTRKTKAS